ncbi:ATP-binding cassette domain-containing protein [Persicobacter sp. CCB-QB2]|uniref:ATP-binding cassette domain-containing protein n=1 Tax=Persicobacter sp. CCB-QB2 TaxID=1561025 RepID=UPI0006A9F1AC|nr:ATP-binding cassette domain-containing protein [Persicobacter sp. CCB-QB2]
MSKLEIDSVQLAFEGRNILSNAFLKCETGNIVGILGRNGSGKSSLLKLIFGTLKADNQSVRINGVYTNQLYKTKGAVHYVPQDGLFMNYLTFKDLVKIFKLESKLDQMLKIEELRDNQNKKIGNMSGGVKKMVEILTLLYADSEFTLLDEPFSYLSPVLVEKLIPHIIHQSKSKGIIMTDHQYQTIWSTANKYYILYEGNLREIFEVEELSKYGYIK